MAAIDDSWDVYDECVRLGLDPDSLRARSLARESMQKRYFSRDELRAPAPPMKAMPKADWLKLFKQRYGG